MALMEDEVKFMCSFKLPSYCFSFYAIIKTLNVFSAFVNMEWNADTLWTYEIIVASCLQEIPKVCMLKISNIHLLMYHEFRYMNRHINTTFTHILIACVDV